MRRRGKVQKWTGLGHAARSSCVAEEGEGKDEGKVHPITGHEDPEGE